MMKTALIFLASLAFLSAVPVNQDNPSDFFRQRNQALQMHNWVLAKPNGTAITVLDLAKRLEVTFRRSYPQYVENQEARLQFYQMAWRGILAQSIDNELILADAEVREVKLNDGEIRQEMGRNFGPNVVETIDELGLTWNDAWEMTRDDLIVQQVRGYMINRVAFTEVCPEKLQRAYEEYLEENPPEDKWTYQVLTIRHANADIAKATAALAQELMSREDLTLEELQEGLREADAKGNLRLTPVEERTTASLAAAYRDSLTAMEVGTLSRPAHSVSRSDNSTVYRIFALQDYTGGEATPFAEMVDRLSGQLMQVAAINAEEEYVGKLREQYGITDEYLSGMTPEDFEPFWLDT